MKFGSRRTILGVIAIGMLCLLGLSTTTRGQAAQAAQAPKPQMAEEIFKNISVLRGIPIDEFMDTMGMISAALGLNCLDCHTSDADKSWERFGADTTMKNTARRMIQMVNTINKENFKGVRSVTCFTCHRGDLRPKVVPSLIVQYSAPVEDPNEVEIPPNAKGPSSDEVFNKYIQALGGSQRVASLTSFTAKGTFIGFETEQTKVAMDLFGKAPAQRTMIVHTRLGDSTRVYDGRSAWIAAPDKPLPLMTLAGGNLEGAKMDAIVSFPAEIKQAFAQWRVGATAIEDKEVVVLQGTNPRQPPVSFYLNSSGLCIRRVRLLAP